MSLFETPLSASAAANGTMDPRFPSTGFAVDTTLSYSPKSKFLVLRSIDMRLASKDVSEPIEMHELHLFCIPDSQALASSL